MMFAWLKEKQKTEFTNVVKVSSTIFQGKELKSIIHFPQATLEQSPSLAQYITSTSISRPDKRRPTLMQISPLLFIIKPIKKF